MNSDEHANQCFSEIRRLKSCIDELRRARHLEANKEAILELESEIQGYEKQYNRLKEDYDLLVNPDREEERKWNQEMDELNIRLEELMKELTNIHIPRIDLDASSVEG